MIDLRKKWNKKGITWKFLVGIILIAFVFFIILGIWRQLAAETKGVAAERLCRTGNALKTGLIPKATKQLANPKFCQVQRKGEIPNGEYTRKSGTEKEKAMKQVTDLTSRCWWMFLEGYTKNGENKDVLPPPGVLESNKKCFICYTFIPKAEFTGKELLANMIIEPHKVEDTSDKCLTNGGGYCAENVQKAKQKIPGETTNTKLDSRKSKRCNPGKKCFYKSNNECLNKGGKCKKDKGRIIPTSESNQEFLYQQNKWNCNSDSKTCYVKDENYMSHLKYIQEGGKGPGAFITNVKKFNKQESYAVVFSEEVKRSQLTNDILTGSTGFLAGCSSGAAVGASAGTAIPIPGVGTLAGGIIGCTLVGASGSLAGPAFERITSKIFGNQKIPDQILVLEQGQAQKYCTVEYGASGN